MTRREELIQKAHKNGITGLMPVEELVTLLNSIEDYDERHEMLEAYLMVTGAEYDRLEPGDHASFEATSLYSLFLDSCKLITNPL